MWNVLLHSSIYATIGTVLILASLGVSLAQVMQSNNYRIQSDSVNFSGGLSTSTNYTLESTAGEVGSGVASSTNYSLKAGYQQMQEVYLAITGSTNVALSPAIGGISGGSSNGSTTITVTTDSPSGYVLSIASTESPALQTGDSSIADYIPEGDPDFTFTTDTIDAHFGYSPEGQDVVSRFLDNGSDTCSTGALNTALACWDGLSLAGEIIAQNASPNHPLGSTTSVHFRVGIGASVVQAPGVYVATTTLTALPL